MPRRPIGRRPGGPLRRPFRSPLARSGIPGIESQGSERHRIPPALIAANQLFKTGEYEEAAKTYLKLAESGIERGFHQAPNLYFQAVRCFLFLEKPDDALGVVRKAFEFLRKEERWGDLFRGGKRVVTVFNNTGYKTEALQVHAWMTECIPDLLMMDLESSIESNQERQPSTVLPTHCPSCGGGLNPKEVEWVDGSSVICVFCGSVVRGE